LKKSIEMNVVQKHNNIIPAQASKDLHRSRAWASDWLKRYDKEGIDGLKDSTKKAVDQQKSQKISYQIKKEISRSKQGCWTTKQR
jgi:transposase